MFGQLKKQVTD